MTRWPNGAAEIEQLVATGELQRVTGGQANGTRLLEKAHRTLDTAATVADSDPDSGFVLAYDAARHAGTALLAQQGLRPTSRGGHYAVERALRAQFGTGFRSFAAMRRRRNELEYPSAADENADQDETRGAIVDARTLIDAAEQLLPRLTLF